MNRFREEAPEELLEELRQSFSEHMALDTASPQEQRIAYASDLRNLTRSRLTEISGKGGGAGLTFAFSLLREAQSRCESVLWLSSPLKPFYPPDAAANGVDLTRLPVLFLSRAEEAYLASAKLLGSGGFGLVVWDLASWKKRSQQVSLAHLGRLNAMARHHRATILILTDKDKASPSLGCLVSLRLQVEAQQGHPELLEVEVVRDKRGAANGQKRWDWRCQLPDGLPASASISLAAPASSKARMAG